MQVARGAIVQHMLLYGSWGGSSAPAVEDIQVIHHEGVAIAYNAAVSPHGHVIVAIDDAFSPVLLYSVNSSFDPHRIQSPNSIESWVIPEIYASLQDIQNAPVGGVRTLAGNPAHLRIHSAWELYETRASQKSSDLTGTIHRSASVDPRYNEAPEIVGPLMTTTWGQGNPYNLLTPGVAGSCSNVLTGCVATAFAQLMRYWSWPHHGSGAHEYHWNGELLSTTFDHPYDWSDMSDQVTILSPQAQKDAVALLMSDLGIATEMDYGCSSSGTGAYADDILGHYFRYKDDMQRVSRGNYRASEWFALIKAELDSDPPRLVVFSIFTTDGGGHETVIDGYQTGPTDKVHINFGWSGYQDGYYDITHNFNAYYEWRSDFQIVVTGIEPDNTPPLAEAGDAISITSLMPGQLSGNAEDPDGFDIVSHTWSQIAGTAVTLSDASDLTPTFIAPPVTTTEALIFKLEVMDTLGAFASDTVTVTVSPPSATPVASAGADQWAMPGDLVTLAGIGAASAGHRIESYLWSQTSGPEVVLEDPAAAQATFLAPQLDDSVILEFQLKVFDSSGQSASDKCCVIVSLFNSLPTADAGANLEVGEGQRVTLSGDGSDPDGAPIVTYRWVQAAGPQVELSQATQKQTSFRAPSVNQDTPLTFRLEVTDAQGLTADDTCQVTVRNLTAETNVGGSSGGGGGGPCFISELRF
jgi:hypothetical protein